MRYISLLFLPATCALAQPTIDYWPKVIGIGHVSAQIIVASADATSATISYGPTTAYTALNKTMYAAPTITPKVVGI